MDGGVRERVVKLFCERDQRKTFLTSVLEYWKDWGGEDLFRGNGKSVCGFNGVLRCSLSRR